MPGAMVREVPPQRELPIDHTILRYNPWLQSRRSHPDQAFVGVWLSLTAVLNAKLLVGFVVNHLRWEPGA